MLRIGSDARTQGQKVDRSRADSLQVVGVDGHGGGGVIGMARDSWVPLATGGKGKINSAMVFGGPKAELDTVRNATGLPIEGYVLIGFGGFTQLVNDAGGHPDRPARDGADASHGRPRRRPADSSDGKKALAYARARKTLAGGDFGRSATRAC